MPVVDSLLTAVIGADGDGLVVHVGEQPYVVTTAGPIEISPQVMTLEAVSGVLARLLPAPSLRTLDELGAVEHELPASAATGGERFTVVAARGGNDVWVEIRRHRNLVPESPASPRRRTTPAPSQQPPDREPVATPEGRRPEGTWRPVQPSSQAFPAPTPGPSAQPAVVPPLARNPVRADHATRSATPSRQAGLDRLLRLAAARGASELIVVAQARPAVRVEGEIAALEGEAVLGLSEVESLILDLAPERSREALQSGEGTEWICDIPDVGRVRCMSFRDHRGPGGIFRMIPSRAVSAEQLGLSREIQSLCAEPDGLILVAGPRASGKSTLISALVDLINRTRSDHVITVEEEIKVVHESRSSLVSQREVRGGHDELAAVARSALRENPDVLVVEDLRSVDITAVALEAAESGRLVIAAVTAPTAATALARLVDQFPPERRAHVQAVMAGVLRGVVAQVLLQKTGGGRVAARELLLNTSAVAALVADGKFGQLPLALDNGRKYGMVPLNDALVAFVRSGAVDAREAYRRTSDRQTLLNLLRREGIDTSFVERLA